MAQKNRQRTFFATIIIVSLLAIFASILLVIIVLYLVSSRIGQTTLTEEAPLVFTEPLAVLSPEEIDPALALASLGGLPEDEVIVEAIQKARPENALAGLLFYPLMPHRAGAGHYLALAKQYSTFNSPEKAVFCNQMAAQTAILSPNIPDNVRADLLIQVGEELAGLEQTTLAKLYLEQAFTIAAYSPYLQAIQRRSIFERLQPVYHDMGEREMARQSLDYSANPPLITPLAEATVFLPQLEITTLPASIQTLEAERWQKAQLLAAILVEREGNAPQRTYDDLQQALLQEDEQKLALLEAELASTSRLTEKINNIAAQIEWLSIKYRVANQGYGVSLVPAWEASVAQIEADLKTKYSQLYELYAEMIIALPDISQIDMANEEKFRYEILAGEVGHYPNYPAPTRHQNLMDVTTNLMANQPDLMLFLDTRMIADKELYILKARN